MPQTAIVFLIGTLSLAGIPLFGGFLSKEEILGAVLGGRTRRSVRAADARRVPHGVLHVPRRVPGVLRSTSVAGSRRMAQARDAGTTSSRIDARARHRTIRRRPMLLPLWILALLSMAVGIYSTFIGHGPAFGPAEAREHAAPGWLTPAAVGVAVAGIAARVADLSAPRRSTPARSPRCSDRFARAALAKFWIDDLFEGVFGVGAARASRASSAGSIATSSTACSTW